MSNYKGKRTKEDLLKSSHPDMIPGSARKVANNTLEYTLKDDRRAIQLHDTVIVTIAPNGTLTLNSGGYKTNTTKERINQYLPTPWALYQERGEWFIKPYTRDKGKYSFVDHMTLTPEGRVTYPKEYKNTLKEETRLRSLIYDYCKGLLKEWKEAPIPVSLGDCFYCLPHKDGGTLGEKFKDTDHLISHLEEKYFMGSLVYNALKFAEYVYPEVIFKMGSPEQITKAVKRYFHSKLGLPG